MISVKAEIVPSEKEQLIKKVESLGYNVIKKREIPIWRRNFLKKSCYGFTWILVILALIGPHNINPLKVERLLSISTNSDVEAFITIISLLTILCFWKFTFPGISIFPKMSGFLFFPLSFLFIFIPSLLIEGFIKLKALYVRVPKYIASILFITVGFFLASTSNSYQGLEAAKMILFTSTFLTTGLVMRWTSSPYGWLDNLAVYINKVPEAFIGNFLENHISFKAEKDSVDKLKNVFRSLKLFNFGNEFASKLASRRLLLIVFFVVIFLSLLYNLVAFTTIAFIYAKQEGLSFEGLTFLEVLLDVSHYLFGHDGRYVNTNVFPSPFLLVVALQEFIYLGLFMTAFGSVTTEAAEKTRLQLVETLDKNKGTVLGKFQAFHKTITPEVLNELMKDQELKAEFDTHIPKSSNITNETSSSLN